MKSLDNNLDTTDLNASHVKLFSKNNPWRPIYIVCLLFLGVGYALYFMAYFLPTPQWGRDIINWGMPTVKALNTAAQVGVLRNTDPFPTQVVILYCAYGTPLLVARCFLLIICRREIREASFLQYIEQEKSKPSRTKSFLSGLFGVCLFPLFLHAFIWSSAADITWREHKYYSSSIGSISFLLVMVTFVSSLITISPLIVLFSLKKYPSSFDQGN